MSEISIESVLLEYLRMTKKRPGMFFGSYNVDHVSLHLGGWRAHRHFHNDNDAFADFFFENFHSFVGDYYQDNRSVGWSSFISENTETEEEGFRVFLSLLEEFATSFASAGS